MTRVLRSFRAVVSQAVWKGLARLAERRRCRPRPRDVERLLIRHQTRGMCIRLTEELRDRLRPGWVRIVRAADDDGRA